MVYILEIENGLKITETIGGDVVVRYLTTFGFPFIRSTNELGATYQVVDTVGEIYNLPTVPSDFTLENINGNIYLSSTGDELIENSLNLKPFRRENLEDRVISLGTIVTTSSAVTVNLPSSGINSILINGNTREKYIKSQFTFTPVTTGIKVLIIYGLDTSEMLYLSEGTEGVEAVEPSIPTGALFVARVIVSSTGTIIEEEDFGYKFKADDAWRQFTIGATPLIVSIGSSNASSFEFLTTEVSPVFGGILTKLGKNTWDGKRYYLKNSSDKDIALEPTVIVEVGQAKAFTFAESYVLKKESWAIIDIVNSAFEMVELGGGGLDPSSLVDKMHAYWDATLGKLVSSGLKFISGAIATLEFLGDIKANALILPANATTSIANRLRSTGGRLKYANDSAVESDIAYLSDLQSRLIKTHTHSGNQEIYFSSIDYATGNVITTVAHGLVHTGQLFIGLFSNDFPINKAKIYSSRVMPAEYRSVPTYIKVIDSTTLKICDISGNTISVNVSGGSNPGNLDPSKWHIEVFNALVFLDIGIGILSPKIVIHGLCAAGTRTNKDARYLVLQHVLSDNTTSDVFLNIFSPFGNPSKNNMLFTVTLQADFSNSLLGKFCYETSTGGSYDTGIYDGIYFPSSPILTAGIKGFIGFNNNVNYNAFANGTIISIFA